MNRSLRTFGGLLFAALLCLPGCGEQPPAGPQGRPMPNVTAATPLRRPLVEWDRYMGRLSPVREVDIRAKVTGYLKSIEFTDGQMVKAGDLLFVIDPRPFESEVDRANAAVAEAEANLARANARVSQANAEQEQSNAALELAATQQGRAKRLQSQGALPDADFDVRNTEFKRAGADRLAADAAVKLAEADVRVAEANVATAESRLRTANIQLGYTQIAAPIDGRVSAHAVSEGNLITAGSGGDPLTTIVSVDPVHVVFDANEQELLKYTRLDRAGKRASSRDAKNPVLVGLVDEPGYPHEGHMDFVDNMVDRNTGTIRGRAILPNPEGLLTPGLFARVRLPGSQPYEAILIPDAAVATDQTRQIVYVLSDDPPAGAEEEPKSDKPKPKPKKSKGPTKFVTQHVVELGPEAYGLRVVKGGLDGSEMIVVRGVQSLRPGAEVTVEQTEIEASEDAGLPTSYEPWPKDRWLSAGMNDRSEP